MTQRGDAALASVMRKLLTDPEGYVAVDNMNGALDVDVSGLQLTEEEQQAIEEVWDQ